MSEQLDLLMTGPQEWTRPKLAQGCGRDPVAGPGTCWWWWEGCPKAAKRGCYELWVKEQAAKK